MHDLKPSSKLRRALRTVGWNALLLMAGLALIGLVGEAWLRSTVPFRKTHPPMVFVPGVGAMLPPGTEIRSTNELDYWTVSRTNRLGFLDREPPSPERAAESCHVAVIGASFIDALQVPVPEKLHVRLEEMAARELPHLDVTTSAFGRGGTGQINQLAFYDEYARPLRPKLVVWFFSGAHEIVRNSPGLLALWRKEGDPDRHHFVSAAKDASGAIYLRPPDPGYREYRLPPSLLRSPPEIRARKIRRRVYQTSWFAGLLRARMRSLLRTLHVAPDLDPALVAWAEFLAERPRYASLLDGWRPTTQDRLLGTFAEAELPPAFEEAWEYTAFALDRFKERTERDGASLVILAGHTAADHGEGVLHRLNAMAEARDVPVVDQRDWIVRQGGDVADARWAHDAHWSPTGHRWAAEALLEYLKRNQDVCE